MPSLEHICIWLLIIKKKIVKIRYPIIIWYCPWHKGTEGRKRAFLVGHSLCQGRNLTQKLLRRSHFTSHWPELVTWPLLDARGAGKVSCWNVLPQLWMEWGGLCQWRRKWGKNDCWVCPTYTILRICSTLSKQSVSQSDKWVPGLMGRKVSPVLVSLIKPKLSCMQCPCMTIQYLSEDGFFRLVDGSNGILETFQMTRELILQRLGFSICKMR